MLQQPLPELLLQGPQLLHQPRNHHRVALQLLLLRPELRRQRRPAARAAAGAAGDAAGGGQGGEWAAGEEEEEVAALEGVGKGDDVHRRLVEAVAQAGVHELRHLQKLHQLWLLWLIGWGVLGPVKELMGTRIQHPSFSTRLDSIRPT